MVLHASKGFSQPHARARGSPSCPSPRRLAHFRRGTEPVSLVERGICSAVRRPEIFALRCVFEELIRTALLLFSACVRGRSAGQHHACASERPVVFAKLCASRGSSRGLRCAKSRFLPVIGYRQSRMIKLPVGRGGTLNSMQVAPRALDANLETSMDTRGLALFELHQLDPFRASATGAVASGYGCGGEIFQHPEMRGDAMIVR